MKFLLFLLLFMSSSAMCTNTIIPTSQGLTLGSIIRDSRPQTVAITEDSGSRVRAINLSAITKLHVPPLALFDLLGYERIAKLIETAPSHSITELHYEQLESPAGSGQIHYAAGLNYSEHASEVEQKNQPFTFLKTVVPTRSANISVQANHLLDYEVEICARPLKAIQRQPVKQSDFAYFLCGDFTERAELLRNIELDNIQSGRGFSGAKSKENYYPTGPYLVIPNKDITLLEDLSFSLKLNGKIRQQSNTHNLIWNLQDIICDLFNAQESKRNTYSSVTNIWLPEKHVTSQATILLGTPEGVIMRPPTLWYKIKMGTWYFVSGAFLTTPFSPIEFVIDRYIHELINNKSFLQPGDRLELKAKWLGEIKLSVQ